MSNINPQIKVYLFTKKQRLTCKITSLKSSINIENVYKFAKNSEFKNMDYGINDGTDRKIDTNIRDSKISLSLFDLGEMELENTNDDYNIKIDRMFEFLKYEKGGHFEEHTDRQRYVTHTHTVCVYPPQNVDGGDIIINKKNIIQMSDKNWTIIIFPIDTLHTSTPVIKGIKYLFKGTASLKYKKIVINNVKDVKRKPTSRPKD